MRMGIANRRKQQAQAVWLRQRIEGHLNAGESLIVLGDLNDGPGLDTYEELFGRSSVEIILGEGGGSEHRLYDPHAKRALTRRLAAVNTTARFYLKDEKRYLQAFWTTSWCLTICRIERLFGGSGIPLMNPEFIETPPCGMPC